MYTDDGNAYNDTLNITHTLIFGNVNNVTLNTGDNITLISDANGTARLADITNNTNNSGNTINGQVEVERFIRTANNSSGHLQSMGICRNCQHKDKRFLIAGWKVEVKRQQAMEHGLQEM